jgi:hypothetical protein
MYPGVIRYLKESITKVDFSNLKIGTIWVRVKVTYGWRKRQYGYCEGFDYNPEDDVFEERAMCHIDLSRQKASTHY